MNWKSFFSVTSGKVFAFVLLLFLTVLIPKTTEICSMTPSGEVSCGATETQGIGYPIAFGTRYVGDHGSFEEYPLNLLLNLIIYYSLSCMIVVGIGHYTRKNLTPTA